MYSRFAAGKKAIAICDRCGFQFKLKELRPVVIKTKQVNLLVCSNCWEPDHPQLQLGMYPIDDPQALRNPRPDSSYFQAGLNSLDPATIPGGPTGGSRDIQWGWNPVGLYNPLGLVGLVDNLEAKGQVGNVTISID
jgi:hypothetical protein